MEEFATPGWRISPSSHSRQYEKRRGGVVQPIPDAGLTPEIVETDDSVALSIDMDATWGDTTANDLVTTDLLGTAMIPGAPYENPDGTPLSIAADLRGEERNTSDPFPGPFATPGEGSQAFDLWRWRGEMDHPDVNLR